MTTLRDATLAAAGGDLYARWRRGAHRVRTHTTTTFDVPGLEEALAVTGLPKDQRRLMETLRAGMRSSTTGRRDAGGNRHLELTVDATPERPATRLVVVEHAGRAFWSRDGERFGELGSARPPAETEVALERVDDLVLERVELTEETDTAIAVEGELSAEQAAAVVDARRILGQDAASATVSARVALRATADRCERRLRAVVV
ncbi:MAG TPA: hypothetical protein VFO60_10545, partial [Candidatus Dormibacteraeota bacterium]|nr:hypothetical protein [Candidatus Dormibacteraeota bacterium]